MEPIIDYGYDTPTEAYIQIQKDRGLEVVIPTKNELQIDIDNRNQADVFFSNYEVLKRQVPEVTYEISPSQSGDINRFHVHISLPFEVTDIERIAFQASLGSDPLRELLSIFRLSRGELPTLFVELSANQQKKLVEKRRA